MPREASESLILRTYPLKESDLIVSFLTRDSGKLRGVARYARRPKSQFGSALERLSHAKVYYIQRENRELLTLTGCDLLQSQFAISSNYEAGVALDYIAEISDLLLPPNEVSEKFFRLLLSVLNPFAPHITEELWERLEQAPAKASASGTAALLADAPWPSHDPLLLVEDEIELPIQMNGKVRTRLVVNKDATPAEIEAAAMAAPAVTPHLEGKTVKKVVVVPGRMVNIVVS